MKFKDTKGRDWNIQFNFRLLCRVEDELGYKIMEDPTSLPVSPRAYVEIAFLCIEDQAKDAGVTPEDFGTSIDGEVYEALQRAVLLELAVFFEAPRPGASALLRKAVEMNDSLNAMGAQAIEKACEEASSALQERLAAHLGSSQLGN